MRHTAKITVVLAASLTLAACADEFDPYEEVLAPRLLAVAADRPSLRPGETATLSALVSEDGATYRWSWCPLVGGSNDGYPCLIAHDDLQAAVDAVAGPGVVTIPVYDLGTGATADFDNSIPPELWIGMCEILQSGELPGPVEFPRCDEYFDVSARLEVTIDGVFIVGVRDLRLLYDDAAEPNRNPVITSVAAVHPVTGERIDLDAAGTAELERDVEYQLVADVAESESETYQRVPVEGGPPESTRESLRLSWFHEGGELDHAATGFTDGSTTFADLVDNEWQTPTVDDWPGESSRLFMVLRDNRGGTSWIERTVRWVP